MIRILHLLSASADFQTETGIEQLTCADRSEYTHEIRSVGRGGSHSTAVAGIISLRHHGAAADVIHAWGETALSVGAMGGNQRIIYSPTEFPTRSAVRWLRSIMDYREVQIVCPTETMRRAFVEHGVPMVHCHMIRPGVDFSRINGRRDPALRAALGFGDDDVVLLAAGESTRAADHERAAWAGVVLHVLHPRHRLLLWGRGPMAEKSSRFVDRLEQPNLCCIASDRLGKKVTFEELLPAADVVLVTGSGPVATLPIAICMAASLPIVAVVGSTVNELLQDRHNALLVNTSSPRAIARRVLDVREDANLQRALCDIARTESHQHFSQTRFVQQFGDLYRQVDGGERIKIPHEGAGAGHRLQPLG
jgi:glycosyltransferase involved in cell wall biosynthesis